MKALILAAGRGSRMGHLTEECPKCMLELAGRTLLDWQTSALIAAGMEEIAIITGYKKEMFPPQYKQFENSRWAQTNMVSSLMCAQPWLNDAPCIASYSDIFYDAEAITLLAQSSADIAVLYDVNWRAQWETRFKDPLSDAETFRINVQGEILEIGNRAQSLDEIQGQYIGLLRFTPKSWQQILTVLEALGQAQVDKLSMTELLNILICKDIKITGVPYSGLWGEADNADDLKTHEKRIA